MKALLGSKACQ